MFSFLFQTCHLQISISSFSCQYLISLIISCGQYLFLLRCFGFNSLAWLLAILMAHLPGFSHYRQVDAGKIPENEPNYFHKHYCRLIPCIHPCIGNFHYLAVCRRTGPQPLAKRILHRVRCSSSSFNCQYRLSYFSCLCLLHRLPVPYIFSSITCFRIQFLRQM